jgi:anti-sigma28 factor (negative regulator of flagellin synthesis)
VADEGKSGSGSKSSGDKGPSEEQGADKAPRKSGAKTQRERAEEKREEKLALIREQIADGTLTVRQMTPEERKKDPPKPREPRRRR